MKYIKITQKNKIIEIMLNRSEKRNAMHAAMINELLMVLSNLESDIRLVIIRGEGKDFCAGADITWMQQIGKVNQQDNLADAMNLASLMHKIHNLEIPTMALVHGATIGGGMGLMCACDIAIAAEDTSFGFPEINIGLAPSVISPFVMKAIGQRHATYYFLTGYRFGAEKAARLGLVHQVVSLENLEFVGYELAHHLVQSAPKAINAIKTLIKLVSNKQIDNELMEITADHIATLRSGEEANEGLQAFLDKRKPSWVVS